MPRRNRFSLYIAVTVFVTSVIFWATAVAGEPEFYPAYPEAGSQPPPETGVTSDPSAPAGPQQPEPLAAKPAHPHPTQAVPAPSVAEKQKDRVLSRGEVDLQLSKNREEDPEPELESSMGFFVSAYSEDAHKDDQLYTDLMGRIEKFIRYFQNAGREKFELYLIRSGKYSDMMRGILGEYGLPGDLIYLALIESGFSPKAYSVARAAGPWQFIAATGRRYGLRIDWWADERRDYEKSTHAAASYLRDLHGMFDSWPLAAAAYNAGEGKIQRAVDRYRSEDFAKLIRYRYLKQETKDYVPKMIAALTIAKEPEKYGFGGVAYEDPLEFDKVAVPGGTDLQELGRIIGVPYESLREWNPELRRCCTPPNRESYEIRLPKGYGAIALDQMEEIRTDAKVTFLLHSVKKGETLASLAERYRTTVPVLQELNGMKTSRMKRSARLVIPVAGLDDDEAVPGKEVSAEQVETALKRLDDVGRRIRTVRVKKGDTLTRIAKRTGVSVQSLAEANGLTAKSPLKAGSRLRLPGTGSGHAKKSVASARGRKKEARQVIRGRESKPKVSNASTAARRRLSGQES